VQAKYSEQVDEAFSPVPILQSRLFDHEIVGVEHLDELGGSLFGDTPPEDILYRAKSQTLRKTGDEYLLTMQIPFVSREEVELTQKDDELYISVGPYKREISLPRVLRGKETRSARLEDGKLMILFGRAS
jgi:arsenite-transporting ATPase